MRAEGLVRGGCEGCHRTVLRTNVHLLSNELVPEGRLADLSEVVFSLAKGRRNGPLQGC